MKKRVVVVIGMHRSGTSLLSSGLSTIGLRFGAELMGGTAFNLKGHWEDNDIVAFNNRVLSVFGMVWDSTDFIEPARWQQHEVLSLVDEGIELLNRKLEINGNAFAFKDPRTVRVLPIWLKIFQKLEISPQFIMPFRNPLDVGASLARREGKPLYLSQLLWMHHHFNYLLELKTYGYETFFVDFYDFCKQPGETLNKLADWLSLTPERSALANFVEDFYDPELITKLTDPFQISENKNVVPWVFDCYRKLRLVQGSAWFSEKSELDEQSSMWLTIGPYLCEQYVSLDSQSQSNKQLLEEEKAKSLKLKNEITLVKSERDSLLKLLEEMQNRLSDSYKHELKKITDGLPFNDVFSKLDGLSNSITLNIKGLARRVENHTKTMDKGRRDFNEQINYQRRLIEQLQAETNRLRKVVETTRKALNRQRKRYHEVVTSTSWKATTPIRWLGGLFK